MGYVVRTAGTGIAAFSGDRAVLAEKPQQVEGSVEPKVIEGEKIEDIALAR